MEAGGTLYTLFGFGYGLDWWPTVFEDAFSPNFVCSACGLFCSESGVLPCGHVLCRRCYDKCASLASSRCPLDGSAYRKEKVTWSTFTRESLLCCTIRCWNTGNGCSVRGTASDILAHFNDDCQYHMVTCQRCRRNVAQKDVIAHLMSSNCGQEQPRALPTLEGAGAASLLQSLESLDQKVTESTRLNLDAMKHIHERQAALKTNMIAVRQFLREEIDGILGQLESRFGRMCSENTGKVLTTCSSIKAVNTATGAASANDKATKKAWEELQQSLNSRSGTEELLHIVKRLDEKITVVMTASKAILENKLNTSEALEWTIQGWSKLKDAKNRGDKAFHWAENPGCFYGYSILPGAEIADVEGTLSLRFVFKICEGLYDQLLPWPFEKEIHFKVLHPNGRDSVVCKTVSTNSEDEGLRMPSTVQRRVLVAGNGIPIRTLETNGYNVSDKIRLSFDVMQ